MKILSRQDYRKIDKETVAKVGLEKMAEAVADSFVEIFAKHYEKDEHIKVFCGTGNNGLDGIIIARKLKQLGYTDVNVFVIFFEKDVNDTFEKKEKELQDHVPEITYLTPKYFRNDMPDIASSDVIVDAIFGTGLDRPLAGYIEEIVKIINKSRPNVISVDVPTGLLLDEKTVGTVIKADITVTFNMPKLALLMPENFDKVGELHLAKIDLVGDAFAQGNSRYHFTENGMISDLLSTIRHQRFDHKGKYGHGMLFAGSLGKMGAAILASSAAMRVGAGKLSVHIPRVGYTALQSSIPEVMVTTDPDMNQITDIPALAGLDAIGVGPGLGTSELTARAFKTLIERANVPLVIDADALNILGNHKDWLGALPPNSILTPHPKEFSRIFAGDEKDDFAKIKYQRQLSQDHGIIIVRKGANSVISVPDGNIFFNATGNPGMATAGTGDVLTGIILGLLTQGYDSASATIIGTHLHGLAGDTAAAEEGQRSLIASDLIFNISQALSQLE
jgi:NAD(P)H-hydrate epimerase